MKAMDDYDMLTVPDQQLVYVKVYPGPAEAEPGTPVPSRTRNRLQIATPAGTADLSDEQAEQLRDWLTIKLQEQEGAE